MSSTLNQVIMDYFSTALKEKMEEEKSFLADWSENTN